MNLAYAFPANAAEFTPNDGRLWVLGGDFDSIMSPTIPAIHSLTLVIKIVTQPTECGREHRIRIELIDSDGARIQPELAGSFTPFVREDLPHRPVGVGLALHFQQLTLPQYGDYAFHILVDDLELGSVPLHVVPPREAER